MSSFAGSLGQGLCPFPGAVDESAGVIACVSPCLTFAAETGLSSLCGLVGLAHLEAAAAVGLPGGPPTFGGFGPLFEIQVVPVFSGLFGSARAADRHLA